MNTRFVVREPKIVDFYYNVELTIDIIEIPRYTKNSNKKLVGRLHIFHNCLY